MSMDRRKNNMTYYKQSDCNIEAKININCVSSKLLKRQNIINPSKSSLFLFFISGNDFNSSVKVFLLTKVKRTHYYTNKLL